jgi:hypothetical protein
MKHGANSVERHTHPRAGAFRDLRAVMAEQRLNVSPTDIRFHRVGENVGERFVVLAAHSLNDTTK